MKNLRPWPGAVLLVAFGLVFATACQSDDGGGGGGGGNDGGGEYVIGYSIDMTDGFAAYELPVLDGAKLAVDEINKAGGVLGSDIRLVVKDNNFDAALAAQTTQELIEEGVDALILPCETSLAVAAGVLAQAAGIVSISSCNTTPGTPAAVGDFMFITNLTDNTQASYASEYACEQGYETAYLLRSPDTEYVDTTPLYFADAFKHNCGGTVAAEGSFKLEQDDFAALVTEISQLDPQPDVIYSAIYVPDTIPFIRQLREAGVTIPVIGADGNDDQSLVDAGGEAAEGFVYSTVGFPAPGTRLADMIANYETFAGKPVSNAPYTGLGYDQVYILAEAIKQANSTDSAAVRDALEQIKGLELSLGPYTFGPFPDGHVPLRNICLVQVQNGDRSLVGCGQPGYIAPYAS